MGTPSCTDEQFIALWNKLRSTTLVAAELGITQQNVNKRRKSIQKKHGVILGSDHPCSNTPVVTIPEDKIRVNVQMDNGVILVGSDCHYWPGEASTAHRAFVLAVKEMKPQMVVINGDAFDGAVISRHGRIGWEHRPSVKQELEAVQTRLGEIEKVAGNAKLHWTWGNHDLRFNSRLGAFVPEFEGIQGFQLPDHFPAWKFSMSLMINDNTQIKHRNYNGIHATYNATLRAGVSTVNGHLHSLKVTPWSDLTGTRYGVDTGSLADIWGPQFNYTEDGTRNQRAGFAVLTFFEGKLMPPELFEVIDEEQGIVFFRGQVFKV